MDAKKYSEFVRALDIVDVHLLHFNGTKYWSKQTLPVAANVDVKFRPELQEVSAGTFKAKASFVVSATTNDTKDKVFGLEFEICLVYSVPNLNEDFAQSPDGKQVLDEFINRNVPVNVWPYAREFISSMTVRMGFPAVVIGTFKINVQ